MTTVISDDKNGFNRVCLERTNVLLMNTDEFRGRKTSRPRQDSQWNPGFSNQRLFGRPVHSTLTTPTLQVFKLEV
jgi:hypothetical protein